MYFAEVDTSSLPEHACKVAGREEDQCYECLARR
jgi:hypothetical protein